MEWVTRRTERTLAGIFLRLEKKPTVSFLRGTAGLDDRSLRLEANQKNTSKRP